MSVHRTGRSLGPFMSDDQYRGDAGSVGAYIQRIEAGELIGASFVRRQVRADDAPPDLRDVFADLGWAASAACAARTDRADDFHEYARGRNLPPVLAELAREFCGGCPVIDECGADADAHLARGLWGGSYRGGTKESNYRAIPLIPGAPPYRPATAAVPTPAAVASPPTTSKEPAA